MTRKRMLPPTAPSRKAFRQASSMLGPSHGRKNPKTENDRPQGRPGLTKAHPALRAAFIFMPRKMATLNRVLALMIVAGLFTAYPTLAFGQNWAKTQPSEIKPPPAWTPQRADDQSKASATSAAEAQPSQSQPTDQQPAGEQPAGQQAQPTVTTQPAPLARIPTPQRSTPPAQQKKFADYLGPELLLYGGVGLILTACIIWGVQKARELTAGSSIKKREPTKAGFSLDELEKLRDQGLMTESEFNRAMTLARAQAELAKHEAAEEAARNESKNSTAQGAPPSGAVKPPASKPRPQTQQNQTDKPDDTPPSGSSPDTRNGELW